MNENTENTNDFKELRDHIKAEIFRLSDMADKGGDNALSGILYTVGGVLEGNVVNSFADVCIGYIEAIKEYSKRAQEKVDPKKYN